MVGSSNETSRETCRVTRSWTSIVNLQVPMEPAPALVPHTTNDTSALPDWCNVYERLSDDEINDMEQTILQRADLSRPCEYRMDAVLLDTDILNEVLKQRNANAVRHATN